MFILFKVHSRPTNFQTYSRFTVAGKPHPNTIKDLPPPEKNLSWSAGDPASAQAGKNSAPVQPGKAPEAPPSNAPKRPSKIFANLQRMASSNGAADRQPPKPQGRVQLKKGGRQAQTVKITWRV